MYANFSDMCSRLAACAILIASVLHLACQDLSAQQTGQKLVKVRELFLWTDAVLISDISVAGKPIACGLRTQLFAKTSSSGAV